MTTPSSENFSFGSGNKASGEAKVKIKGTTRWIKPHLLFPTEIKALSIWGAIERTSSAVAFSLVSLGAGLLIESLFVGWENLNPLAKSMTCLGTPVLLVLGVIAWLLGKHFSKSMPTLEAMIRDETRYDDP